MKNFYVERTIMLNHDICPIDVILKNQVEFSRRAIILDKNCLCNILLGKMCKSISRYPSSFYINWTSNNNYIVVYDIEGTDTYVIAEINVDEFIFTWELKELNNAICLAY